MAGLTPRCYFVYQFWGYGDLNDVYVHIKEAQKKVWLNSSAEQSPEQRYVYHTMVMNSVKLTLDAFHTFPGQEERKRNSMHCSAWKCSAGWFQMPSTHFLWWTPKGLQFPCGQLELHGVVCTSLPRSMRFLQHITNTQSSWTKNQQRVITVWSNFWKMDLIYTEWSTWQHSIHVLPPK